MLAYSASAVHRYGWIPLNPLNWRNVKATVFGSCWIHFQSLLLLTWTLVMHLTGLGLTNAELHAFQTIWGTVFAGAAWKPCTCCLSCLPYKRVPSTTKLCWPHTFAAAVQQHPSCPEAGLPVGEHYTAPAGKARSAAAGAGAVFNLATIVVFILGLFTTLVINRWWSIRTARAPPALPTCSARGRCLWARSACSAAALPSPHALC